MNDFSMESRLIEIAEHFITEGPCTGIKPFGSGLVHRSYKVYCKYGDPYILQQINTFVFRQPVKIMENIDLILEHIRGKIP